MIPHRAWMPFLVFFTCATFSCFFFHLLHSKPVECNRTTFRGASAKEIGKAAEEYGISEQTARNYMRMYRDVNRLPPKHGQRSIGALSFKKEPVELDELKSMTKEELIQELIKARITEARLKKGYEVKGDGTVILYASKTTK